MRYVKDQTEAICMEAVRQGGDALRYVRDQTEAICMEAVKKDGYALQYVKEQCLTQPRELTLEEICDRLGYQVKVVTTNIQEV